MGLLTFGTVASVEKFQYQPPSEREIRINWVKDHDGGGGSFLAHCRLAGSDYAAPAQVPRHLLDPRLALRWARNYFNNPDSPGYIK